MKRHKHKRKLNHVLILTSDAADANVRQFRVRAWIVEVVVLVLCVLIGGVIGYFIYEGQLWDAGRAEQQAGSTGDGAGRRNTNFKRYSKPEGTERKRTVSNFGEAESSYGIPTDGFRIHGRGNGR